MRVHEIRNDVGKAYLRQDHLIVLGVLKGIIEGLLPCWLGLLHLMSFLWGMVWIMLRTFAVYHILRAYDEFSVPCNKVGHMRLKQYARP